jgi:signal transduction histidine kinase
MTMGTESIRNAIAAVVRDWLNNHPVLGWCAIHPLWAIALLLLFIFSAWGLLGAIAQLVRSLWIVLLRAPFRLGRWIGVRILNLFRRPIDENSQTSDALDTRFLRSQEILISLSSPNESESNGREHEGQPARLSQAIARLEQLQREQVQLLQEVRAILHQTSDETLQPRLPSAKVSKPQKNCPDLSL